MPKKLNFKNWKSLTKDWIVTLSATLIGVFTAIYMNEVVASKKIVNQKSIATRNIFFEIEKNRGSLLENIQKLETMAGTFSFVKSHMDKEDR